MRYLGTWNTPGNADELNLTNETGRAKKIPLDKRTRSPQKLKTEHRRDKDRLDMKKGHEANKNHKLVT